LLLSTGKSLTALGSDWEFTRYRLEWSAYQRLWGREHLLAVRWWMQQVTGTTPYQELSKIGDSWTARGYKADRFLDKAMSLASLEYRFPLYKSLGAVLFTDAGKVMPDFGQFRLSHWHTNWGWGLRYYLTNFVVRFDMGISGEGSRIFFNFGQVF
jgi:outer membrane protein insertion porin family